MLQIKVTAIAKLQPLVQELKPLRLSLANSWAMAKVNSVYVFSIPHCAAYHVALGTYSIICHHIMLRLQLLNIHLLYLRASVVGLS